MRFGAKTSNGYRVQVVGTRVGDRHRAKVVVARGATAATYRVPARIRPDSLRANLGDLGQIDVRFHARDREVEASQPGCFGRPPVFETGFFEGLIRFRGENGYTRLSATRDRGGTWNAFREACRLSGGPRASSRRGKLARHARRIPGAAGRSKAPDKGQLTELGAAWTGRSRSVSLSYVSVELSPGRGKEVSLSFAAAEVRERRGRMEIERSAFLVPDSGALLLAPANGEAQTATLTLPPPVTGSASYESLPGTTPAWSGSLQADLPGASAVPLAGKRFVAALCQGTSIKKVRRCMRPIEDERERFSD
jgi:hypothetical protein